MRSIVVILALLVASFVSSAEAQTGGGFAVSQCTPIGVSSNKLDTTVMQKVNNGWANQSTTSVGIVTCGGLRLGSGYTQNVFADVVWTGTQHGSALGCVARVFSFSGTALWADSDNRISSGFMQFAIPSHIGAGYIQLECSFPPRLASSVLGGNGIVGWSYQD